MGCQMIVKGFNPKSGKPFTGNLIAFMDLEIEQEEPCNGLDGIQDPETRNFVNAHISSGNDFRFSTASEKVFLFAKQVKKQKELSFKYYEPTVAGQIVCDVDTKQNG